MSGPIVEPETLAVDAKKDAPTFPNCTKCGAHVPNRNYLGANDPRSELNRMIRDDLCFNCAFWSLKAERKKPVVIDGSLVVIGSRGEDPRWRGYGGAHFTIEFFDGRVVETNNLWHNGKVPLVWRDAFPDTARFVPDEAEK